MSTEVVITVAEYHRRMESIMQHERLPVPSETVVSWQGRRVKQMAVTSGAELPYRLIFYGDGMVDCPGDSKVTVSLIPY